MPPGGSLGLAVAGGASGKDDGTTGNDARCARLPPYWRSPPRHCPALTVGGAQRSALLIAPARFTAKEDLVASVAAPWSLETM